VRTTYRYDQRQRLTALLTHHASRIAEPLIHFSYAFDAVSNIRTIEDQRPTSVILASDPRRNTQAFAYDDLYRLTRVQYNVPAPTTSNGGEINYRYDRIGNMLSQTSDMVHLEEGRSVTDLGTMNYGGNASSSNRQGRGPNDPPGPHALTQVGSSSPASRLFPYDANGNMTQIDGMKCTWDFKDRLVAVEDDTMRAEYRYDFSGQRILKRVWPRPGTDSQPTSLPSSAVTYPDRHFEVREHDEPTKYVFNGDTRVARITGSLSTNNRIQRLRLYPGWNLVALAVTAPNLLHQLSEVGHAVPGAPSVFRWNEATGDYSALADGQTVAAGTVLWIKSITNSTVAVTGSYVDPTNRLCGAGGSFQPGAGLEAISLSGLSTNMALWNHDAFSQTWQIQAPVIPGRFPKFMAPGSVIFVQADAPAELEIPAPALRLRYYHQDHLGSSSIMTDADGALVEETAFYPFGIPRLEHRLRQIEESYKFTQKERDEESGLHYFEARYLSGPLARFASVDPKYASPDALSATDLGSFMSAPQKVNLYACVLNNPLKYWDPTGLDEENKSPGLVETVDKANDRLGFIADVNKLKGPGLVFDVIGVGIKTGQFVDDPSVLRGVAVGYDATKAVLTAKLPPVGLALQALDLIGIGPGSILDWGAKHEDEMNKVIEEKRQIVKAYKEIGEKYEELGRIYQAQTAHAKAASVKIEAKIQENDDLIRLLDHRIQRSNELLKKAKQRR